MYVKRKYPPEVILEKYREEILRNWNILRSGKKQWNDFDNKKVSANAERVRFEPGSFGSWGEYATDYTTQSWH